SSAMVRDLGVASYLGIPLVTPEGHALGTLCVADFTPRSWGEEEVRALTDLAASALTEIQLRSDVGEQERVREVLRRQAALLDLAHDSILVRAPDSTLTFWNRGAERTYGWTREEALGQSSHSLLQTRFPSPLEEIERELDRDGEWKGELVHTTRSGARMVVASRWALQRDERGSPVAVLEINRDITPRKRAEEALQEAHEELERRVRERTAELEAANRELEAFSYSVSHDLRAPLRSIDGFGQALLEDYADVLDETGKGYLQRVRSASQRMAQLIDDLLELSRVTRSEMRRETVDLSAVAREIAAELEGAHPARRVEWVIDDGVTARGDPRLLRQALENLLGNAWKYTAKQPDARIEFGEVEKGAETVYFVRDNGAGFEMAYADKLFAPFQRLHSAHEFEGTGIGLATVQRILRRHGGRIWAEAEVGQGATFHFSLPLREGSQ
ncbi:MAG: ATP-binding protein, partial [Gemmatimonadota bacterium]|nr:ATP-binding protein [Gemmatimonadota bacterium]